ncbi:MAG TPA: galactokinase [Steroidobacteraceae bacterium]|nr:galactokinase [Steroidobacteraceae bacterium]
MTRFEQFFGYPPEACAEAHGRVNLLGEHTDYNEGFVLPTIIPQATRVWVAVNPQGVDRVVSAQLGAGDRADFARYALGCLALLRAASYPLEAMSILIDSDVPIGAGLSSSAALEVAVLRAARSRFALDIDDVQIARLGQQAEIEYAGVHCGIMDQMAASVGVLGHMLLLDTRSLARSLIPLPQGADLCVLDSGIPRSLATSAFNQRRSECEQAARALGERSLRDVDDLEQIARLPPPLDRRVRHVVTENRRVLAAVNQSASGFGRLMNASHASLRDDFAVSVPALDLLVDFLQRDPRVFGARLTGAGFGGACVALVHSGTQSEVARDILAAYGANGHPGARRV